MHTHTHTRVQYKYLECPHVSACHSLGRSHYWFSVVKAGTLVHHFDKEQVRQRAMRRPVRGWSGLSVRQMLNHPVILCRGCGGYKLCREAKIPTLTQINTIYSRAHFWLSCCIRSISSEARASRHCWPLNTNCLFISETQILLLNAIASYQNVLTAQPCHLARAIHRRRVCIPSLWKWPYLSSPIIMETQTNGLTVAVLLFVHFQALSPNVMTDKCTVNCRRSQRHKKTNKTELQPTKKIIYSTWNQRI